MLEYKKICFISKDMIDRHKIRAARGLADWTQGDLADRAGLSAQTVAALEKGDADPAARTLEKITRALEREGIFFTEWGVERRAIRSLILPDYAALLDRILADRPAEALFLNADDRKSSPAVRDRMAAFGAAGIAARFLLPPDGQGPVGPLIQCRRSEILPRRDVTVLWGDHVAWWTPDGVPVLIHPYMAGDYRAQFQGMWDHAKDV